jgi:hypothetical protein
VMAEPLQPAPFTCDRCGDEVDYLGALNCYIGSKRVCVECFQAAGKRRRGNANPAERARCAFVRGVFQKGES